MVDEDVHKIYRLSVFFVLDFISVLYSQKIQLTVNTVNTN